MMTLYIWLVARPNVLLTLGSNLQADNIKEGDDVYFDCRASASPTVTRLEWFHNVSKTQFLSVSFHLKQIYSTSSFLLNTTISGREIFFLPKHLQTNN